MLCDGVALLSNAEAVTLKGSGSSHGEQVFTVGDQSS